LDLEASEGYRLAKIEGSVEGGGEEAYKTRDYRQGKHGVEWKPVPGKEAVRQYLVTDILFGPFSLKEDGSLKHATLRSITARVIQERKIQLNHKPLSSRRKRNRQTQ
jgi:hypothetical protein